MVDLTGEENIDVAGLTSMAARSVVTESCQRLLKYQSWRALVMVRLGIVAPLHFAQAAMQL